MEVVAPTAPPTITSVAPSVDPPSAAHSKATHSAASTPARKLPQAHILKHVKLPEYDGKRDVNNFFTMFEKTSHALGATGDEEMMSTLLLGRLKGAALAWVQGV